ncbi:hypothetical protein [Streptomyces lavendulae]|uniref:hypothetical protein n=1 Tax=Streptomyces lavendulae TaxID=1914 RepID=UPI0024A0F64A|nr:hypothetical protein [Streptomyces lavendulae]GLW04496.1 hypothetical protein Slala05_81260 [Streptomyces lavendulae subsp. lavendulae]
MAKREVYDVYGAASRLRVSVAAWRWAAGSGLVPAADVGEWSWSRAVVEAADPEAVRAALRGPVGAGVAADRLTEALGVPLPRCRPRVTAAAVGHLVRAGLLVYLGGETEFPDVHPDQVAVLGRRRDLPALLDRHVPLGPDQAAVRLGVRRTEFDLLVERGYVSPVGSVAIDFKRQGGVTTVPLFSAEEVALLPVVWPSVDWRAARTVAAGRRSPLAGLDLVDPGGYRVLLAGVARIARVGRAAVVQWRRRYDDFPAPVGGTGVHPEFDRAAVLAWLLAHGKIEVPARTPTGALLMARSGGGTRTVRLDDPCLTLAEDASGEDRLSFWSTDDDADTLAAWAGAGSGGALRRLTVPGGAVWAVPGGVRVVDRVRTGAGGLYVTLAWSAGLRGAASSRPTGGVIRHALPYSVPGEACVCRRQECGGLVPVGWCVEHGDAAGPAVEWHPGGGLRCAVLAGKAGSGGAAVAVSGTLPA